MGYVISFFSLKAIICFFVIVLVGSASSRNQVCPFDYLFHTGDGFFDVGNAIIIQPKLPANKFPYGITNPGFPSGRWSDGLLDIDIGGVNIGFPTVAPSLTANVSDTSINFATASSPVLDRSFFTSRGVRIPSYAAPLSTQLKWFRKYLKTLCSTPAECTATVENSLFIFGDVEANDIGISLTQGKSIEEARTYVPFVTEAQIDGAKEVIRMGTTRVVIPGSAPIGCFPYILTKFRSNNPQDYDDQGCLRKYNDLIKFKNKELQKGISRLVQEFPKLTILYADIYSAFESVLQDSLSGPNKNVSLKACCGTGGKYNYNSKKGCGTSGVPVCADPLKYLHWDGVHLTQNGQSRLSTILQRGTVAALNCTAPRTTVMSF